MQSLESISHGHIGHVGWDLVLLAQSLELSPCETLKIHGCRRKMGVGAFLLFVSMESFLREKDGRVLRRLWRLRSLYIGRKVTLKIFEKKDRWEPVI